MVVNCSGIVMLVLSYRKIAINRRWVLGGLWGNRAIDYLGRNIDLDNQGINKSYKVIIGRREGRSRVGAYNNSGEYSN